MTRTYRSVLLLLVVVTIVGALVACGARPSAANQRMRLDLTSPASRGSVTEGETTVTGVVSEPSAKVTVNDVAVEVGSDGAFTHPVALAYGSNRIVVKATAEGFVESSRTVTITRNLTLEVTAPPDGLQISERRVTVSGVVSDPGATVHVAGFPVSVNPDGSFSHNLNLHYPATVISVVASIPDLDPISQLVSVEYTGVL